MKRTVLFLLCAVLAFSALAFSSCGIADRVENAVTYPAAYSLTYEITSAEGVISTVTKTVDANGNVYLKTAETEKLYLNDNGSYTLYEKDENGSFVTSGEVRYTAEAVSDSTAEINEYTERSKDQFIPTAKKDGEGEVAGRACVIYKLGIGGKNNSAYNYYYVDSETGICLRVEVRKTALGEAVENEDETFICTEFITENIEDLSNKII